jgi:shikimate kinase
MRDYYDYQPTHSLTRPLALISFVSDLTRAVANSLASTTGLPLRLLDDVVEHQLGASSVAIMSGVGLAEWRRVERRALAHAVRSRPPAILALGEGAMGHPDSLETVLAETDCVYLYLSSRDAQRRVVEQAHHRKATVLAEIEYDDARFDDELARVYSERRHVYEQAPYSVDVRGQSTVGVGQSVLRLLDRS